MALFIDAYQQTWLLRSPFGNKLQIKDLSKVIYLHESLNAEATLQVVFMLIFCFNPIKSS